MADRMYALLAIGISLSPTRLDENTMIGLKERYGEQYAKMQRGYVVRTSLKSSTRNPNAHSPYVAKRASLHSRNSSFMHAPNS
jgi:hypothetical protein